MKKKFYSELCYVFGLIVMALGCSLTVKADFGVSMVVAPAYLLFLKISNYLPFFTFGMAEYTFQAILLIFTCLVLRKFKVAYLFSFVTAVVYGCTLDGWNLLVGLIPYTALPLRIVYFITGTLCCCIGVALFFHTYISPEVYELFVKEVTAKYHFSTGKFKTIYDCSSLLLAVLLSFLFFKTLRFDVIGLGTLICAVTNGFVIGAISKWMDRTFNFVDRFPLREKFV